MSLPRVETTPIPGLLVVHLDVRSDGRGWFKENWQREKLVALGVPDLGIVQNNVSYNTEVGVTRGLHAEPWDKYVAIAHGRAHCAWVDLREGPSFGRTFELELDESTAVFVPRGVANGYQTLVPDTAYTYLVNAHWSADARYTFVNLADPALGIGWPVPAARMVMSDKDRAHPELAHVVPIRRRPVLVLGAGGQLANALVASARGREVVALGSSQADITDPQSLARLDFRAYEAVVNAAAWTDVDGAERPENRAAVWALNATAVGTLARRCEEAGTTLVHVSSDYVFDGTRAPHREDEPFSPLGVYGQAKAAGDLAAVGCRRHYVVRTSWLVGDGRSFVATMADLAARGVDPAVVDDQVGRLTFTADLAAAIWHLLEVRAPYGTYNVTCSGEAVSWAQVARDVFALVGADPDRVRPTSTAEYFAGKEFVAPRPLRSELALDKLVASGFTPRDGATALREFLARR